MAFERGKMWAILRAGLLVCLVCSAPLVLWYSPSGSYLSTEALAAFLKDAGAWAPILFIVAYAIGVCLFVPAILFCTVGAIFFGTTWGFIYIWLGSMLGASLGFFMARTLGRDFVASLLGSRFKSYDDAIGRNGFAAVLYLRLLYTPFSPTSLSMGLTKVHFRDYITATGIGIMMGNFLFVFLVDHLKRAWLGGDWTLLWSDRMFFGAMLFVLSLSFPLLLKRWNSAWSREQTGPVESEADSTWSSGDA